MTNRARANFAGLAYNFLNLVEQSINEMEKHGNRNLLILDPGSTNESYDKITCWNDLNIGIPILFNFYHGLELIMKALLWEAQIEFPKDHKLSKILQKVTRIEPAPKDLIKILNKYIITSENPFSDFFESNSSSNTADRFYILLKYPSMLKDGQILEVFDYSTIKDQGSLGLQRFLTLKADIASIQPAVIQWNLDRTS